MAGQQAVPVLVDYESMYLLSLMCYCNVVPALIKFAHGFFTPVCATTLLLGTITHRASQRSCASNACQSCLCSVMCRCKHNEDTLPLITAPLMELLARHVPSAIWCGSQLSSRPALLLQLLTDCPHQAVRSCISNIMIACIDVSPFDLHECVCACV